MWHEGQHKRGEEVMSSASARRGRFVSASTLLTTAVAAGSGAYACTLGSDSYVEAQGGIAQVVVEATRVLTGKEWDELGEKKKLDLVKATWGTVASHVLTEDGTIQGVERWLAPGEPQPGAYRVHGVEDHGDHVEVSVGGRTYLIEARYGCYSVYGYDILVWSGYGGQLCEESGYDPETRSCP